MFTWFKKVTAPTNYSFDGLKSVHMQLLRHRDLSESSLVELLRVSSEFLIYSDQHSAQQFFFEYFCEKNMLALFVQIGEAAPPHRVQVQLLQTLSLLVQNITTATSLYYILSNNYINRLMTCRHFQLDQEDVRDWYVTFLKALSIRLNVDTVQFFFNAATRTFPLYLEALKFRTCPEIQVQIAVKTVLLNVLRVPDDRMRRFLTHRQNMPYFMELVDQGQVLALKMQGLLNTTQQQTFPANEHKLHYVVDATIDHWYYLQDILDVPLPDLSFQLGEWVFESYLKGFVARSLVPNCHPNGQRISTLLALFLLVQVFQCMSHSPLLNAATFMYTPPPHKHSRPPLSPRFVLPKLPVATFQPHPPPPANHDTTLSSATPCSATCYLETRFPTGEWPPSDVLRLPLVDSGNVHRQSLLALLQSSDSRLCLGATAVLHAMASNKNVDRALLQDCRLKPAHNVVACPPRPTAPSEQDDSSDEDEGADLLEPAYDVECVDAMLMQLESRPRSLVHVIATLQLLEELTGARWAQKSPLSHTHETRLHTLRRTWALSLLPSSSSETHGHHLALWDKLLDKCRTAPPSSPVAVEWSHLSPFHAEDEGENDVVEKYLSLHVFMSTTHLLPAWRPLADAALEDQQHETAALKEAFQSHTAVGMDEISFLPCHLVTNPDDFLFCLLNVDAFVLVRPGRDMTRGDVQRLVPLHLTTAYADTREPSIVHVSISPSTTESLLFQSPEMAQQALLHFTTMKTAQEARKWRAIETLLNG
ncbi:hypothetical protein DYB30_003579 [Aphanomyces astaci]|uniref:FPL domain-containing protein n=1 Tax=Aphanomyces astaci TaxID=112090 RepID=A0A397DXB5_APHAT|nr:hypothetical protein DYB30_003579 [Aphanomyces astaci]